MLMDRCENIVLFYYYYFYYNLKKNYEYLMIIKNNAINNKIYIVDRYHIIKYNKNIYDKIIHDIENV